jgi:hypothetical protein
MRSGGRIADRLARAAERQRLALIEELRAKMAVMPDAEIARLAVLSRRGDHDGAKEVWERWGVTEALADRLEAVADEQHPLEGLFAVAFADVFRRSRQINAHVARLEAEHG